MKRIFYLLMLLFTYSLANGQFPTNDLNTFLFDDFSPWCQVPVFESHHGTPTSHGVFSAHSLWRNDPFCLFGLNSEGEGIRANFNFIKNASYTIDVNVASFVLNGNNKGKFRILLVNNPVNVGCQGSSAGNAGVIGGFQPIPSYSPSNMHVLFEHTITSDMNTITNFQINFESPSNFNGIVIYPEDLDNACNWFPAIGGGEVPAFVRLELNCVRVHFHCIGNNDLIYTQTIPSGVRGARNFFIGNNTGITNNTQGQYTNLRAKEAIFFNANTMITNTDGFLAEIVPCHFPYLYNKEPEIKIENVNSCGAWKIGKAQVAKDDYYSPIPAGPNSRRSALINDNKNLIYPNPVEDNVMYSLSESNCRIKIYSSIGVLVKIVDCNFMNGRINVSNLANGIYFIQVVNNQKLLLSEHKLIKK